MDPSVSNPDQTNLMATDNDNNDALPAYDVVQDDDTPTPPQPNNISKMKDDDIDDHDKDKDEEEKDELYAITRPKKVQIQQDIEIAVIKHHDNDKNGDNDNDNDNDAGNDAGNRSMDQLHPSQSHVANRGSDDGFASDGGASADYLKSTLKRNQQSWIDPWEAAVQDTFYHKQINSLRPTFDIVHDTIRSNDTLKDLFQPLNRMPSVVQEELDDVKNPDDIELEEEEAAQKETKAPRKFGAWDGVMAGCLLNIFGVIMFLRVGFIVGQAGIIQALIIMTISAIVVTLTALSMSAICTNGTILAGGAYYIISRALGPSVGGAVGILFSLGNMVACSMYLIGFAETLTTNLDNAAGFSIFSFETNTDSGYINNVRIWSNVVLCIVLILALVGLKYVIKAQLGLLAFITVAIILFFVGSFYREVEGDIPNPEYDPDCSGTTCEAEFITGIIISPKGWTNGNFIENLSPAYVDGYDFWTTLSIFFPAVTGIMAGANISGDLNDPSHDIPLGTLTAIGISTVVYMIMAVFVGAVTVRYALLTNDLIMSLICVWEYIVLIGVYAATLSSAIASLVGAPRILQAVAGDNLFPYISYFAKGDREGNPIRGYFLSFGVAFACNLIGQLNAIAPLISQFFMLTYLLINAACFALEFSKSPGWRPSFKYFNKWTAGLGAFLCLIIMFLLNWVYALVSGLIAALIYSYVAWKDPEVNWGAAPQARNYYNAYKSILKLRKTKKHIKNWRPGVLVLVRDPIKRTQMMLFGQTLKKSHGPIFYATVHTGNYRTNIRKFHEAHSLGYLPVAAPKNAKGFYEAVLADTFRAGVQNLLQLSGMGSIRPNTLVIGYKRKWCKSDGDKIVNEYVQILRDTLLMGMGIMVCCGFKRINWFLTEYAPPALQHDIDEYPEMYEGRKSLNQQKKIASTDDDDDTGVTGGDNDDVDEGRADNNKYNNLDSNSDMDNITNASPMMSMPRNQQEEEGAIFLSKMWAAGQGKDTIIDVWWMIDDGGLCMLMPYIMKLHKFWSRCKLRMLMVSEENDVNADISTMKQLMKRFRLPYIGPKLVPAKKSPHPKTIERYEKYAKSKLKDVPRVSVVKKWLILSELLFEYSRYSGLNVVTLPIPSKSIKPRAYMAILHLLSDQDRLPPTIIMRGNGESTLTFYSE